MKLQELKLSEFLPKYMQSDETAKAFEYAVQKQILRIVSQIKMLEIYTSINTQPESVLDELGWQFNIPEYTSTLPIETKRNLIKTAILTHKQRGTPVAVERVVKDVFGDGYVEEWFNYGGEPYHFKVHTSNVSAGDEEAKLFESIIASSQNVRSYLEAVMIETVVNGAIGFGGYIRVVSTAAPTRSVILAHFPTRRHRMGVSGWGPCGVPRPRSMEKEWIR